MTENRKISSPPISHKRPVKVKRIYISGPMTDKATGKVSEENLQAFHEAEKLLADLGCKSTVNPIRVWACRWPWLYRITGYKLTLLYDLLLLMRCTHIYKIPGWRESRGANIESCVAYHFKIWQLQPKTISRLDKRLAKIMSEK